LTVFDRFSEIDICDTFDSLASKLWKNVKAVKFIKKCQICQKSLYSLISFLPFVPNIHGREIVFSFGLITNALLALAAHFLISNLIVADFLVRQPVRIVYYISGGHCSALSQLYCLAITAADRPCRGILIFVL
jgi:hypothetical protein